MNHVVCNGNESTLYECEHAGWKKHVCQKAPVYLDCKRSEFLYESRFDVASLAVSSFSLTKPMTYLIILIPNRSRIIFRIFNYNSDAYS